MGLLFERLKSLGLAFVGLTLIVLAPVGCREQNQYQAPPAPTVTVAQPVQSDVIIYLHETGQTEAVDRAELNLEYTEVQAPITGNITKTYVKRGNLVNAGMQLATVVQHDPIYANFSISERYLNDLKRKQPEKHQEDFDPSKIPAYLQRNGDSEWFSGQLNYIDQEGIDPNTGTLKMRAVFPNPQRQILPGAFVRVRVPVGKRNQALLIPEQAIGADPAGRYVLVVTDAKPSDQASSENPAATSPALKQVERRNITTGTKHEGLIVVDEGLQADDWVIVTGIQRARPGTLVKPTRTTLSQPSSTPASASPTDSE